MNKTTKNITKEINQQNPNEINNQPIDLNKVKKVDFLALDLHEQYNILVKQTWLKKNLFLMKLPEVKKQALKKYIKQMQDIKNAEKKDFNKDNLFEVKDYNFWYMSGKKQALFDINLEIKKGKVTSLIGPSGCGKSTFIKSLNRMNDLTDGIQHTGNIWYKGKNIESDVLTDVELRTKVGMIFQKPTPFEMSIYDNVAFGPRSHGIYDEKKLALIVEQALKDAALWEEVKDELHSTKGTSLSGGQQQRLCIARAIALQPEVILMDEPTSALDPIATTKIEELVNKLSQKISVIIVTHSMAQAQRISDETIFFYQGRIVESGLTKQIFTKPKNRQTRDYVNGKIG